MAEKVIFLYYTLSEALHLSPDFTHFPTAERILDYAASLKISGGLE